MTIRTLQTETIELEQDAVGSWDENGDYTITEPTSTVEFKCSLQPLKEGLKQTLLPSGLQTRDSYIIYSVDSLKPSDDFVNEDGDVVRIDGFRYVIYSVEHWRQLRTKHFKSIAVRSDKQG